MKLIKMNGLTGRVKFDKAGLRTDFTLGVVRLQRSGLVKVGLWSPSTGLQMEVGEAPTSEPEKSMLENSTLVVTTVLSPPYTMWREATYKLVGNQAFEGFAMDLMAEISTILKFKFRVHWSSDGEYGAPVEGSQEWSGMLGEVISGEADLAIADLTITSARNDVVDFSMPFMKLGISVLYEEPKVMPPTLFAFMAPFSQSLWCCIGWYSSSLPALSDCLLFLSCHVHLLISRPFLPLGLHHPLPRLQVHNPSCLHPPPSPPTPGSPR